MNDDDTEFAPMWPDDTRAEPSGLADERAMLSAFLDWHRATLELKCTDVPRQQLSIHQIPPSRLTLHGLVRHLAAVEQWWFHFQFAREIALGEVLFESEADPDADFNQLDGDFDEALAVWREQCRRSREIVAAAPSLDATATRESTGEEVSLRWILIHMIAEYARHNGHADVLREQIDGAIGR